MRWWPFRRRRVDPIDDLIVPPIYKFRGHDEEMETRARARREQAETIRRQAVRLETQDDRRAKFTRVK